jgi:hypothetical protein
LDWLLGAAEYCSSTESTAAALLAAQAEQPAIWKSVAESVPEEGKKVHRGAAEVLKALRPVGAPCH